MRHLLPEETLSPQIAGARRSWRHSIVLIAVFILARLAYWFFGGIRFDARPLEYYVQYLDPALLRNSLFQSLWYLKEQMPGFNLLLGVVLELFPGGYET